MKLLNIIGPQHPFWRPSYLIFWGIIMEKPMTNHFVFYTYRENRSKTDHICIDQTLFQNSKGLVTAHLEESKAR